MNLKPGLKVAIKLVLTALVLAFVARHVARTWRDLRSDRGQSDPDRPGPGSPSRSACTSRASSAFGVISGESWSAGETDPGPPSYPSLRAYLISHLGKYVPGKAMVVVDEGGAGRPPRGEAGHGGVRDPV